MGNGSVWTELEFWIRRPGCGHSRRCASPHPQELVRGGHDGALVAAAPHQRLVIATELAPVGARCGVSTFDEHRAQGLAPATGAGAAALAGAAVIARTQARPCGEALGAAEGVEVVGADLGEDGAGRGAVDAGDGLEPSDALAPRLEARVDVAVEPLEALVQGIVLAQQVAQDPALDGAQLQAQRIAKAFELVCDVMAERGEDDVGVEPLGEPVEDAPPVPAEHIAQDAADAHTAAVEDLLNPVADPAALTDEGAPVAGQHTHLAKRLRRHMARGGQGELAHPCQPYAVADDDLKHIARRRRAENKLGFALQLCALRYPGRVLRPGELIPTQVVEFIGSQLDIPVEALLPYAARRQTRQQHMEALRSIYGYRNYAGQAARRLKVWLDGQAEGARSNEDLARRLVGECRRTLTVLPATTTVERLCADALVAAERRVEERIASRLDTAARTALDGLLSEAMANGTTRFVWLRQFEPGSNSAAAGRLLDRLEYLQRFDVCERILEGVPAHRVTRLRQQGERHFADGLREAADNRRRAILAVCVVEWRARLADTLVDNVLANAAEAVDMAWTVVEGMRKARQDYGAAGTVHLFMAAPAGVAMMIGQLLNTFKMVQTYEYVQGTYQPAALLTPST